MLPDIFPFLIKYFVLCIEPSILFTTHYGRILLLYMYRCIYVCFSVLLPFGSRVRYSHPSVNSYIQHFLLVTTSFRSAVIDTKLKTWNRLINNPFQPKPKTHLVRLTRNQAIVIGYWTKRKVNENRSK